MKYLLIPAILLLASCSGKPLEIFDKAVETGGAIEEKAYEEAGKSLDAFCSAPSVVRDRVRDGIQAHAEKYVLGGCQ